MNNFDWVIKLAEERVNWNTFISMKSIDICNSIEKTKYFYFQLRFHVTIKDDILRKIIILKIETWLRKKWPIWKYSDSAICIWGKYPIVKINGNRAILTFSCHQEKYQAQANFSELV